MSLSSLSNIPLSALLYTVPLVATRVAMPVFGSIIGRGVGRIDCGDRVVGLVGGQAKQIHRERERLTDALQPRLLTTTLD